MPSGLDGNPNPVVTVERTALLEHVAGLVVSCGGPRVAVGIDGASGVGKSTFADELARILAPLGTSVVRSTTDSFHRPRAERYARGRESAEGYYLDSHDLPAIVGSLLEPFASGAELVRTAAFDEPNDSVVEEWSSLGPIAVLVFDGLFLHRPELRSFWDVSVLLVAEERREREWEAYLSSDLPSGEAERRTEIDRRRTVARRERWHGGWELYEAACAPAESADVVIENNSFSRPFVVRRSR